MKVASVRGLTWLQIAAVVWAMCVVLFVGTSSAQAQEHENLSLPFLEPTDVGMTSLNGAAVFEASIQPHLVIVDNLAARWTKCKVLTVTKAPEGCGVAFRMSGTPGVTLRMFLTEPSSPVRTPSYMPRVNFQWFFLKSIDETHASIVSLQTTVGHHSNGQDGCLMTDPSGQCVDDSSNVSDYIVNRINGSFSTNYIRVGAWYRRTTLAENREDKAVSLGLTYEANPVHFLGGAGIHGLLAEEYGRNRVTVSGNINQMLNDRGRHVEVQGSAQAIIGANSRVPPVAVSAQISFFPGNSDWGVFANYFRGQDYYNAGFADLVSKGTIGATYTYDGFFLWRRQ